MAREAEVSRDMSALPKVMQVKRFGRKGNTKYTHLADQDTSREGQRLREKFNRGEGGRRDGRGGAGSAQSDPFFSMAPRGHKRAGRLGEDGRDVKRAKR